MHQIMCTSSVCIEIILHPEMTCQFPPEVKSKVSKLVPIVALSHTAYLLFRSTRWSQMSSRTSGWNKLTKWAMRSHLATTCLGLRVGTVGFCLSITGILEKLRITEGRTLPARLPSCSAMLHSSTRRTGTVNIADNDCGYACSHATQDFNSWMSCNPFSRLFWIYQSSNCFQDIKK